IATMEYIRTHTTIPVPLVHYYDASPTNSVGTRYMILELVRLFTPSSYHLLSFESPAARVWHDITPQQREAALAKVMALEIQLLQRPFPVSGYIVDQNGTVDRLCQPSRTESNLDDSTLDGPLTCEMRRYETQPNQNQQNPQS
ncbi:hypothetical protein FB45DRAFT_753477, partial [Roridomyces roridus]